MDEDERQSKLDIMVDMINSLNAIKVELNGINRSLKKIVEEGLTVDVKR
jgi:hypothetical protein